ncbi:hypothetical protein HN695_05390 [Candidatus Woesearchaeota archaeon]|jgi:hypothetical protein|nr:hypothetical protein [Candidatus Woesearchaeota archaeon]MBT5272172.1 hypothetical protein [Candidatus Woesearchaeota archaeon]MBT6040499.1 hypothetical protein [Candidatus Woesearchaeota archaeon]MBT6336878.1 hypothetical protein [Candidatus Woesearchaeota archaeon]MBT7927748.1 hypothetical protein [Candidatus Woesearchaeota archaeon]
MKSNTLKLLALCFLVVFLIGCSNHVLDNEETNNINIEEIIEKIPNCNSREYFLIVKLVPYHSPTDQFEFCIYDYKDYLGGYSIGCDYTYGEVGTGEVYARPLYLESFAGTKEELFSCVNDIMKELNQPDNMRYISQDTIFAEEYEPLFLPLLSEEYIFTEIKKYRYADSTGKVLSEEYIVSWLVDNLNFTEINYKYKDIRPIGTNQNFQYLKIQGPEVPAPNDLIPNYNKLNITFFEFENCSIAFMPGFYNEIFKIDDFAYEECRTITKNYNDVFEEPSISLIECSEEFGSCQFYKLTDSAIGNASINLSYSLEICKGLYEIDENWESDRCYWGTAMVSGNESICENIIKYHGDYGREFCPREVRDKQIIKIISLAVNNALTNLASSFEICEDLYDDKAEENYWGDGDDCYWNVAMEIKDKSICNKIRKEQMKENCQDALDRND